MTGACNGKLFLHRKAVLDSHYPRKTRTHFIGYNNYVTINSLILSGQIKRINEGCTVSDLFWPQVNTLNGALSE